MRNRRRPVERFHLELSIIVQENMAFNSLAALNQLGKQVPEIFFQGHAREGRVHIRKTDHLVSLSFALAVFKSQNWDG
jgi:hypothetical protein